ncbi:immunoglobulin-like domain-containing protein [Wukongibacter baidiensis]|uniref:immunoglobulin-like domain-containing protein n=1 Tax=Wukongibacter baidiensis TaxID=1723361 RepID=UPI003D7FEF67
MKKYITIIMCILLFGIVYGYKKDKVFIFEQEDVQSLSVYTYNFDKEETTNNWVYQEQDMKGILNFLENLRGKRINSIDVNNLSGLFYGVQLHAGSSYYVLFAEDYAISYTGEYFRIDGEKAKKMCQSIVGDTKVNNQVSYIVNHRYISLIEGEWNTKYMIPTYWTGEQMKNVQLVGTKPFIDSQDIMLEFTILNNTGKTMEFGSRLMLETQVNDIWYSIDNMLNSNINLGWTSELNILDTGKSKRGRFYLSYYQPLPTGRYRLIKEVNVGDKVGYVAYEFDIR